MNTSVADRLVLDPAAAQGYGPGDLAAAIMRGPVLVSGTAKSSAGPVVAAVDDDDNPGDILRYAAAQARRLGVPLRVVHVWAGRRNRHDTISDADRLLSAVLYDHLTPDQAAAAEREIRHDDDVVRALTALSAGAALLVIAARRRPTTGSGPLGSTARALLGSTACPVAVLPPNAEPALGANAW
ncbi:universal stress protein [Actinoplanes sp. NPDC049668]|uniref:universal stress protein n=1 Tax=unclassified Actinoplanes TaxID=2626549 RepID=UPI0033B25DE2